MATSNKCKSCGAELVFGIEEQTLVCTHCASKVEFEKSTKELEKKEFSNTSSIEQEPVKFTQFLCSTCGRGHISPADLPLTRCPSCGAMTLERTMKVAYRPDGIIPFKIKKDTAYDKFYGWVKHRKLAPNNLKKFARAETLNGMYIPAYAFDFDTFSKYSGVGETKHEDGKGNSHTHRENFSGTESHNYKNYFESACSEVSSYKLQSLGGYNVSNICLYSPEYLYGWIASEVVTKLQDAHRNLISCVESDISNDILSKKRLRYDSVSNFKCSTTFSNQKYSYVYLPIWKGTYKYKSKDYYYYVNGENGSVTGNSPKSVLKILLIILAFLGFFALVFWLAFKFGNSDSIEGLIGNL
ncbi:MAG: hypothetical protein ACI4L7_01680 [Christensenellales bacterium]